MPNSPRESQKRRLAKIRPHGLTKYWFALLRVSRSSNSPTPHPYQAEYPAIIAHFELDKLDARAKNELVDPWFGAREHALARACAKSPLAGNLFVAPGNPGCTAVARTVPLNVAEHANVIAFCQREDIDLVVVGPEAPLVAGLADDLLDAGISCFGPTRMRLGSKGRRGTPRTSAGNLAYQQPTIGGSDIPMRRSAISAAVGAPIEVKVDGLASGKGVVVAKTVDEAEAAVEASFESRRSRSRR